MSLLQVQRAKKTTYQRGVVACRKCAAPIYIYRLKALPDEFSVTCAKCGNRGIYLKSEISFQELPERRRKPRK